MTACEKQQETETQTQQEPLPEPHFVGGQHCRDCHQTEFDDWRGSHHDLSMQTVSEQSVLGDFDDSRFQYAGVETGFSRDGDRFLVRTHGPGGEMQTYPVAYVFGVYPLQQYLLELPGGRLQAFGVAWDARPAEEGGQRWFHLYPDQAVNQDDYRHWTRQSQNWNFMCAECHSTQLEKNYQPATRTYETGWSEIDVSCEACHGPGSNHLLWADENNRDQYRFASRKGLTHRLDERKGIHWEIDRDTGQPKRSKPLRSEKELQTCAACHSRRSQFFEDDRQGQPLMDSFLPATLDAGLYHSDGQVNEEVYVYGSFLQSKMHRAGVTCSDCHNPHSLSLRAPGNDVCQQCHSASYATEQHHHHPPIPAGNGSAPAAGCVDCHMPAKHFMVVDERRDHSFRIPRPDLSATLGVPNTCNACHEEQSSEWAAQHIRDWYGDPNPGYQQFAGTLAAARAGQTGIKPELQQLATDPSWPAIVRATAASLLGGFLDQGTLAALETCLQDRDPLVRVSAIRALENAPGEWRWQMLGPLLTDASRLVRAMAAEQLVDMPSDTLTPGQQQQLARALDDYTASQQFNADSPQGQLNLGLTAAQRDQPYQALEHYREAIALDDTFLPAYVNLADLYRQMQQDDKGETLLEEARERFPDSAEVHYSLGLLQVRQGDQSAGLDYLRQAAQLAPDNTRYQYVYAVGLNDAGETEAALAVVREALQNHPDENLRQLERQLEAGR